MLQKASPLPSESDRFPICSLIGGLAVEVVVLTLEFSGTEGDWLSFQTHHHPTLHLECRFGVFT